ncbi:hypothetical protein NQZ68_005094 [Dissostichus eleginoides]|nr:hypothetical protein NQZ68_005094 [Dissostichus eleginoides]
MRASMPVRGGGEVAQEWKEGASMWTVPLLIEMYPTQKNPTSGWIFGANIPPPQPPGRASPSQEPAGTQRVGGMNLTCRWTQSKGSCGWGGEARRARGVTGGTRSVPVLPRLRAEGRGMTLPLCLG